jgi:predicted DNA-binding protein
MPREKKDNVPISIKMEKQIYERLTSFCNDSGQPKTTAIERAVQLYIDIYEKKYGPISLRQQAQP